jgi:hypothetical protein
VAKTVPTNCKEKPPKPSIIHVLSGLLKTNSPSGEILPQKNTLNMRLFFMVMVPCILVF